MAERRTLLAGAVPAALTAASGLAVWEAFRPGLMSFDSIAQYGQAMAGRYTDWHPPLISILLHFVLVLGGGVSLFMLAQCLAGVLGARAFAAACLRRLYGERIPPRRAAWLSTLVQLLLLVPPSPLAFYLMTFWKDSFALVLLLWIGTLALRERPSPAALAGLVALAAAWGQVRHNSIVTLPFLGMYLWAEARRWGLRAPRNAAAAAPLAASLVLGVFLDRAFDVQETHPSSQVMALELVGLCSEAGTVCRKLPVLRRHLRGDPSRYRPGDIGSIFWEEPPLVDSAILGEPVREDLAAEYRSAALGHPLLLAEVKAEAFWRNCHRTSYFFHSGLIDNPFGLSLDDRFRGVRERLAAWTREGAEAGSPLRWAVGVHLVWMAANGLWIAGLLLAARRLPAGWRMRSLALFLFVPMAYYASYLLASTVPDFRFMFPATLMIQCLTLTAAAGLLAQKPAGRAPYRASVSE